jgi:hypothetical protein
MKYAKKRRGNSEMDYYGDSIVIKTYDPVRDIASYKIKKNRRR